MLKYLNSLLCLEFRCRKRVLEFVKTEWYYCIKSFLSLSNITPLFSLYVRGSSTILKVLQGFRKLAFFPLLPRKLFTFLKATCSLLVIFLKFVFNEKEKHGFIWDKTFNFSFQKRSTFCSEKGGAPSK